MLASSLLEGAITDVLGQDFHIMHVRSARYPRRRALNLVRKKLASVLKSDVISFEDARVLAICAQSVKITQTPSQFMCVVQWR